MKTSFYFKLLQIVIMLMALPLCVLSCRNSDDDDPVPVDDKIKFMVFTDLHYMHPDILINEGKAFDDYNAEECKLLRESGEILDAAIERIRKNKPEFVIICGDMTKDGEVICHEHIAQLFGELENEIGTKVYVVPGNHDMNNPHSMYYDGDNSFAAPSATEEQFAQIYSQLGYSEAVERRAASLDYMAYPTDDIAIIGVDSNEKNTEDKLMVQGGLSREQVEWILNMAEKAHSEGRYVIMTMHHNLVDFYNHAQIIRGANIANARYEEYDNQALIDDLCAAGIDVVFSGHSHMHSITSATSNSHTIYSVVTSSLVNLPLAYRCGEIDKDGRMSLTTEDLKNTPISSGVNLVTEGDKYWRELTAYYMNEATDKTWKAAGLILQLEFGFKCKEDLRNFFHEHVEDVFYTFLTLTSNGNEHLVNPAANVKDAEDAVDSLLALFDKDCLREIVDFLLREVFFGIGLEDVRQIFYDFFNSAYYNYLYSDPMMPDDAIGIQLTGV